MMKRRIRTLAGLRRASRAFHGRLRKHYERPYVLQPALARNLARFDVLQSIEDPATRFEAFRQIPALEFDLEAVWSDLTGEERESLAQQDRASHPRVALTSKGETLRDIIRGLLLERSAERQLKAKQYWPLMLERLAGLGLTPFVTPHPAHPDRERIQYFIGTKRRFLTIGQFVNIVSEIRRRSRTFN